jgi:hypothetical protein
MAEESRERPDVRKPKSRLPLLIAILVGIIASTFVVPEIMRFIPQTTAKYQAAAVKERLRNLKNFVRYYAEDNNNTLPSRKQLVDALVDVKRSELVASIESGQIEYPNGGTNLSKADPALPLFVARYKDKDGKSVVVTVPISDVLTSESPGKAKN